MKISEWVVHTEQSVRPAKLGGTSAKLDFANNDIGELNPMWHKPPSKQIVLRDIQIYRWVEYPLVENVFEKMLAEVRNFFTLRRGATRKHVFLAVCSCVVCHAGSSHLRFLVVLIDKDLHKYEYYFICTHYCND
ncbi:hypothetical protein MPSEU_000475700 [Mayamaea pseudoterrestris]|nr:hypothetical protein MPSEU_000475700 [Mayamaea pseudoterrestris]